jgi:TP901 family phage tail tape measure protein
VTDYSIIVKMDTSGVSSGGEAVRREMSLIEQAADTAKRAVLGLATAAAFQEAVQTASQFETAMAEVSTLVDEATFNMAELNDIVLQQARTFGSLPVQQAQALYQIISAGATSAARATEILEASNRLAIGGVTDVATAADGLTSVLNAYGDQVESAAQVSDVLFIGMRAGKTTIGELAATLGRVAPLAATAGVSIEELTAGVAALTKGGIATTEAVTGMRAIMAAVTKPTSEATELAQQLGLEFNAAALQAEGFGGFMQQVIEKTGGSNEALAVLFGGIEAIVPAMAFAGQAGQDFAAIMEQMANSAGATDAAFQRVFGTSGAQYDVLISNITVKAIELGAALLSVLGPAVTFVNENFDTMVAILGAAVAGFLAYRAAAVVSAAITLAMAGNFGILVGTVASATAQFGLAAGAQVAFAGASAFATTAVRGFTAALISSPLAPIAIALTVAGAAYYYLSGATNDSTSALQANAEAQQRAAELQAQRAQIIQGLVNATVQERQETINAMKAAVNKANADIQAARAALTRAAAERDLAASIARRANEQVAAATRTVVGAGAGYDPALGAIRRAQPANDAEARAQAVVDQRAANIKKLEEERDATQETIRQLEALGTVTAPATVNLANLANTTNQVAKANEQATTTFADIKQALEEELRVAQATGVAREVLAEQLRAEAQLKRALAPTEASTIERLIREIDATDRLAQYKEQVVGGLERERQLLSVVGIEREVLLEKMRAEDILKRKLTDTEAAYIEAMVRGNDQMDRAGRAYENIIAPVQQYRDQLQVLVQLLERGAISQREFNTEVNGIGLVRDTNGLETGLSQAGLLGPEAQIEQVRREAEERQLIVDQAEEAGIRSAQRAAEIRIAIARDEAQQIRAIRAAQTSAVIGSAQSTAESLASIAKDMVGEQSAAYRAMFIASKAFAIADSIIKIQQGIANALSLPFPANLAAVAAVAAQAASIVANIKAVTAQFADGGYVTGPGGRRDDRIPALLSNGEYVVNANATAANRPLLEAINSGRRVTPAAQVGGGAQLNVKVENYAPGVRHEVQQIGPDEFRIIAREEATAAMDKGFGEKFEAEIARPNSKVSKALSKHTDARPRR